MGTTYERAGADVVSMVRQVMADYYPELTAAQVTVDVLLAYADPDSDECAVKAHGYPAAAVVRKVGLKDRVKGCADAEIVIDGDRIDEWSERQLMALLDHELYHLEPQRDQDGEFKTDDIGRPKLAIRLHDRQFGWFNIIAQRWGEDSFEVQQALEMVRDYDFVQLYLPGFNPLELGTIKKEQLAESIEADRRNGETTPLFDKEPSERANVFTRDGRRITVNQMVNEMAASFSRKSK